MTDPAPQQFKSAQSGRLVVPGWMNLVPNRADAVEIQLDVASADGPESRA